MRPPSSQNQHQPSRGITTDEAKWVSGQSGCQNQHQPSRGITTRDGGNVRIVRLARININPVEGLQHAWYSGSRMQPHARININPVEGLQPQLKESGVDGRTARININPVEGLQLVILHRHSGVRPGQNQHQPSRGITTGPFRDDWRFACLPESTSTQSRDYNMGKANGKGFYQGARININPVEGLQHVSWAQFRR